MKLIVDSGSTKAAWLAGESPANSFVITTAGINPVRDDEERMRKVIARARDGVNAECLMGRAASLMQDVVVRQVWFYGAGCIPPYSEVMRRLLSEAFPSAHVEVASDLLGAARALCGHEEGIACILGTGSNSCLYDGRRIVRQTPALGWILGDEGSGAVLGRLLVGDVLKGQLPLALCAAFLDRFGLTQADLIERVYRQPLPNRFLASLVPFLVEYAEDAAIHAFLVGEFRRFLRRNVVSYGRNDLAVNFVGGIAYQFEKQLREALSAESLLAGRILRDPVTEMALFHS